MQAIVFPWIEVNQKGLFMARKLFEIAVFKALINCQVNFCRSHSMQYQHLKAANLLWSLWKCLIRLKQIKIFMAVQKLKQNRLKRSSRIWLLICLVTYSGCPYSDTTVFFFFYLFCCWTFANCMNREGLTFCLCSFLWNRYKRTKKVWKENSDNW